jgi:hypothetical protein
MQPASVLSPIRSKNYNRLLKISIPNVLPATVTYIFPLYPFCLPDRHLRIDGTKHL